MMIGDELDFDDIFKQLKVIFSNRRRGIPLFDIVPLFCGICRSCFYPLKKIVTTVGKTAYISSDHYHPHHHLVDGDVSEPAAKVPIRGVVADGKQLLPGDHPFQLAITILTVVILLKAGFHL